MAFEVLRIFFVLCQQRAPCIFYYAHASVRESSGFFVAYSLRILNGTLRAHINTSRISEDFRGVLLVNSAVLMLILLRL
jgi:hypothetical protein